MIRVNDVEENDFAAQSSIDKYPQGGATDQSTFSDILGPRETGKNQLADLSPISGLNTNINNFKYGKGHDDEDFFNVEP